MHKFVGFCIVTLLIGTTLTCVGMNNQKFCEEIEIKFDEVIKDYEYVPGQFIVKFKEQAIFCDSLEVLNKKYNVISIEDMFTDVENTPLDNIYKFKVPVNMDIFSIVKEYSSLSNVVYAEPNYIIKIDISQFKSKDLFSPIIGDSKTYAIPDDPFFGQQWNLENTGQYEGIPGCDINALEAWDIETGSSDVIIAIIDSGVDYTHPDLVDNIWINEDEIPDNDVDDDNNGFVDDYYGYDAPFSDDDDNPLDFNGHGTVCAGIASAVTNNGIGLAGVCWNCKIMIVQPWDENYNSRYEELLESVKYATDNGADIISMSYGHSDYSMLRNGYEYAYEKGVVLIAAAGNGNTSRYFSPAGYDYVMAIAATNQRDERCDPDDWGYYDDGDPKGSNFGYWVDVAAPANNLYLITPTHNATLCYYRGWDQNYTCYEGGGTSWATPTVAGIAALLLSQDPTLTNDEVRRIIRANVDPYVTEEYIGTGRVNAYKALTRFNTQPETPDTPSGKTNGIAGFKYSFKTSATDLDGDELWYFWDWGDGNYSDWLGPYASGQECKASYTCQQVGNFLIKVKVKDGKGGESYWSNPFSFSTPKIKISNQYTPIIEHLIQRFPVLELFL